MLVLAAGFSIASAVTHNPGILSAATGPLIAGVVNLSVALGIRRRIAPEAPVQVQMSPQAKSLLLTLYRHVAGWPSGPFVLTGRPSRFRMRRMQRRLMLAGYGTPVPEPNAEVLALLEGAATAYNRISAVVTANQDVPAIAKMAPRVLLAADEAMSEVFHQSASLSLYPEGVEAGRKRIEGQIASLTQVAGRLESLAGSGAESTENRLRSTMDDVLSELRFEQLARTELQAPVEEQTQVHE
jgi:hypothetical protein